MNWLKTKTINDVFKPDAAEGYMEQIDTLWEELVNAHSSMYVVEKVRQFPAELLLAPAPQHFWRLTLRNFSSQAALTVINALTEQRDDTITFYFIKELMKKQCRPEVRQDVEDALELLEDGQETKDLLKRARTLRNKILAHFDTKAALDQVRRREIQITFQELQQVVDESRKKLQELIIGDAGKGMVPIEYDERVTHPPDMDSRSDIERILDREADTSAFLKLPETDRDFWLSEAAKLTEDEKEQFNYWRERLGLLPV